MDDDGEGRKRLLLSTVPLLSRIINEHGVNQDNLIAALRQEEFSDGEYVYHEGDGDYKLYFISYGKVIITQRQAISTAVPRQGQRRRRSAQEADMEIHTQTHSEGEYFGEFELVCQQGSVRQTNAVTVGDVICMTLSEDVFQLYFSSLVPLMRSCHLMKHHGALENDRLFKDFTQKQQQYVLDNSKMVEFREREYIFKQGDEDDGYFFVIEGKVKIILPEQQPNGESCEGMDGPDQNANDQNDNEAETVVIAERSLLNGFGEMGLLGMPRTASAVAARGGAKCLCISKSVYQAASRMQTTAIDEESDVFLATTLIEEWNLAANARKLRLANPRVAHYLVLFVKKFKAAYNKKCAGKTMYLDLFRSLNKDPRIGDDFPFLSSRLTWDSPSSSLGMIRADTRRILSRAPSERSDMEASFIGHLLQQSPFLDKFDRPVNVSRIKLGRCLGKVMEFISMSKGEQLFCQGAIESKAFIILRGSINIVNEDINPTTSVQLFDIIATLVAGYSLGELSLLSRLQRSASAIVASDADLLVLDQSHLKAVMEEIPGLSIRHVMIDRANFLMNINFFKSSDMSHCIRIAHDVREADYTPRHIFTKKSSPGRTLQIIKSGEVAVFLKHTIPVDEHLNYLPVRSPRTPKKHTDEDLQQPDVKTVLVRVATIGSTQYFDLSGAVIHATSGIVPSMRTEISADDTIYMATSAVQMLELPERAWRRLTSNGLECAAKSLLERQRWNARALSKLCSGTTAYYHADRPWKELVAPRLIPAKIEEKHVTALGRRLYKKLNISSSLHSYLFDGTDDSNPTCTSRGPPTKNIKHGPNASLFSPPSCSPCKSESPSLGGSFGHLSPRRSSPRPPESVSSTPPKTPGRPNHAGRQIVISPHRRDKEAEAKKIAARKAQYTAMWKLSPEPKF